jgi:hypothetical protein
LARSEIEGAEALISELYDGSHPSSHILLYP